MSISFRTLFVAFTTPYLCHLLFVRVMKSNGKTAEIEGDELKYWRSSGGQLGIILAVEMQLVKETEKGGTLAMKHSSDDLSYVFADAR